MALSRIVYFSENAIGPGERGVRMAELQRISVSNNRRREVTGALVYDDHWFAQALEGELPFVEELFDRISRDTRHTKIRIVSKAIVSGRLFGNWSMGFAARKLESEPLFGRHWFNATRTPTLISETNLLKLMVGLGQQGFIV